MSEQEAKSHKFKNKKIKKKRRINIMLWDDVVKKQAGYALVALLGLFGIGFGYVFALLEWPWLIVFILAGAWEILDTFLFFYIHYVFKIEIRERPKEDTPMSGPVILEKPVPQGYDSPRPIQ